MTAPQALIAFFQKEAADSLDHLDRLLAAGDALDVSAFLTGVRALRGNASMTRLDGLPELAATIERLAQGIGDQTVRWELRLQHAVRSALADLRLLVARAEVWGEEEQRRSRAAAVTLATTAASHLTAAPLPDPGSSAILPIARLAPDDGRPSILERNPSPPITLAQRFRSDMATAAGEVAEALATVTGTSEAVAGADPLRRALMSLADVAESYAAASIASLATKMARAPLSSVRERDAVQALAARLSDRTLADADLAQQVRQASLAWSGHGQAPTIASIDTLLYRGHSALQRAREVRDALRQHWQRGTLAASEAHALFDELSDLLDLAVTT